MPSYLPRAQRVEDYLESMLGGEVFTPICPFCNTASHGERCKNCGAPMPQEHFMVPPSKPGVRR